MTYLTSEHLGPKLKKPKDDVDLCVILLHMVQQQLESMYWIILSE